MTIEDVMLMVRPNVLKLKPYSSARDEFTEIADVYLDANENPYELPYHRYPDPYQTELKKEIATWKQVEVNKIFVGNGSDEVIDLIIKAFCKPEKETIVALNPSYGMYGISAGIQEVGIHYFGLDENFQFEKTQLLNFVKPSDKVLFLCSPNNPSGNVIHKDDIAYLCNSFDGIVVVDEAYIDFADCSSLINFLDDYPNLIVIQTLSKAMGAAGIRLGMGFMHNKLVSILNKIKPPYNVNELSQNAALDRIKNRASLMPFIAEIKLQRDELFKFLSGLSFVLKVYPSEANFLLVKVIDANNLYNYLASKSIVVRNRNTQFQCEQCIRITIGTPDENQKLKEALLQYQKINLR